MGDEKTHRPKAGCPEHSPTMRPDRSAGSQCNRREEGKEMGLRSSVPVIGPQSLGMGRPS